METIIYNKYSNERIPEFNIRTEIVSDNGTKKICKYATNKEGEAHIKNMYKSYVKFCEVYGTDNLQMCPCTEEENRVVFEFIEGDNLKDILLEAVAQNDMKTFYEIFDRYVEYLKKYSCVEKFQPCEMFLHIFGKDLPAYDTEVSVFRPTNLDMVFDNIISKDGTWYVIDYEWVFDIAVPMEFVLFRTIFYLMYNSPYQLRFEEMDLYAKVGIEKESLPLYEKMEVAFQAYVVGNVHAVKEYYQRGIDIKELMVKRPWERDELILSVYKDTGNGFSETEKDVFIQKLDENGAFSFEYEIPENVKKLRLDPGEVSIVLHIEEIPEGMIETNGVNIDVDRVYFAQDDPWFVFDREKITGSTLCMKAAVGKVDGVVQENMNRLRSDVQQLQSDLQQLQANLQQQMEKESSAKRTIAWKLFGKLVTLEESLRKSKEESSKKKSDITAVPDIAIHLHLFYVDLLEEFVSYFKNIPYPFNLYISCVKGADAKQITTYAKKELPLAEDVVVKILPNRGRDIAPFYVGFREEVQRHKYVLHIHSKKSKHIEKGGSDWRVYSLDSLIGSRTLVETIIGKFENESQIGLIYPEVHPDIPMIGFTWMANGAGGQQFLQNMGIPYEEGLFSYPTGSFFWARVDAIRPIFEKQLELTDFPLEKGQIDGTFAHVLERAIAFVNKSGGFHSYIIDTQEDVFRYDKSLKPFREYMSLDLEKVKEELMQYDSISFEVFDTLLTSDYLNEDCLIRAVQQKFGLNDDFFVYRKEAERIAKEQYGAAASLDAIYGELTKISPFDIYAADQLMQAEITLFEQRLYPRYEMRELYRYLLEQGKKVVIVSDSHYSTSMIEGMLVKAGCLGYHKIFVSCDYGYSKRNEHMWNIVYHEYNQDKHIHIGADVYADWYTLEKRGARSRWIMSGMEAYKLSKYYDENYTNLPFDESMELGRKINREWFNSPFDLIHQEGMQ